MPTTPTLKGKISDQVGGGEAAGNEIIIKRLSIKINDGTTEESSGDKSSLRFSFPSTFSAAPAAPAPPGWNWNGLGGGGAGGGGGRKSLRSFSSSGINGRRS